MKLNTLTITAGAAMLAFGLSTAATAGPSCPAGQPAAASATSDSQTEANGIMQRIAEDARTARNRAGRLQSLNREKSTTLEDSAYYWQALREEVNDMGGRLCRLEAIRASLAPWQQKAVDKIAASIELMAGNTQRAIEFGNQNQHDLWRAPYPTYVDNLYNEATTLTHTAGEAVQYAHVLKKSHSIQKDLGVKAGS